MHRDVHPDVNPARELAGLRELTPEEDAWPTIRRRLRRRRPSPRRAGALGLAAALVLAVGIGVWVGWGPSKAPASTAPARVWIARSQVLAQALSRLDTRYRVLDGARARVLASLKHRIALVELRLSATPPERLATSPLWRRRAELMAQLLVVKSARNNGTNSMSYAI